MHVFPPSSAWQMRRSAIGLLAFALVGPPCAAGARNRADEAVLSSKRALMTAVWHTPFDARSVSSNHAPLGPYMGNGDVGVVASTTTSSQTLRLSKVDFVTDGVSDWAGSGPGALPAGGMTLQVEEDSAAGFRYEMDHLGNELRLTTGTAAAVRMTSWMATDENIVVTALTTDAPRPVRLTLTTFADSTTAAYATTAAVSRGMGCVTRRTRSDNVRWISEVGVTSCVIGAPSVAKRMSNNAVQTTFSLTPGRTVYVVGLISGGGRGGTAQTDRSAEHLSRLGRKDIRRLEREKTAWWHDMWIRSYAETGDSLLDRHYLSSIYLMASAYNSHSPACGGMYGVMYHGDMHFNYNSQGGFYSVFSANRAELALPFFDAVERLVPEGRRRAQQDLGKVHPSLRGCACRGILFPVSALGIGEFYGGYWQQTVNAPFNVPLYSWYFEYTADTTFLRQRAYPYIRECGDFYEDYLQRGSANGTYCYNIVTGAHEDSWDMNPPSDLAFVELTFHLLLRYSNMLNVDATRRARWQDIVSHLPAYTTVMPTREPNEGKPVMAKNEAGWDLPPHVIQLHAVYPCELINLHSERKWLDVARNTLYYYGISQRGLTDCMNELGLSAYVMAARVGFRPDLLIDSLRTLIGRAGPNFLITDGHHCLEKAAAVETINSMMLQNVGGVLHLFPSWPQRPASFTRLRAKGAFVVSAATDGHAVTQLHITAERGGRCRVRHPWPGQPLVVTHKGRRVAVTTDSICTFDTRPGQTFELSPLRP